MNRRTGRWAALAVAALLLGFALYSRQDELPVPPEVPAPDPDLPLRRVTRIPPVPPPDEPVPAVASDTLDRAEAVLAEVMGGVRVNCPIPPGLPPLDLPQTVQGLGDRVHLVQVGPAVRGVVPPFPYAIHLRTGQHTLVDCGGLVLGSSEARECHDEQVRANQSMPAYAGTLRWEGGVPGNQVPCIFEPIAEDPFRGVLTLSDGRTPRQAGIELLSLGCAHVRLEDDGAFSGSRYRQIACAVLIRHPTHQVVPPVIGLDTRANVADLSVEVRMGAPHRQTAVGADTIAMLDSSAEDKRMHRSPLVVALERTDLPDDVRAHLEIWRRVELRPAQDLQQQADALRAGLEAER